MSRSARIAAWVACVAGVLFAAVAVWEIGAPLEGGHWASMSACAIAGENMLRYRLFAAVTHYPVMPPPSHAEYYCRHPYAIYLMEALGRALFGHHPWVVRLPAVVCSAVTPFVLFRLGKALWGPVPAAVATVGFVVVPIDLAFACFSSLEVPTILFGLVFCLGTVRVWQGGGRRDVATAALGALGACHSDWIGAVLVAAVVGLGMLRVRGQRRWLLVTTAVTVGTVGLYLLLVLHDGQMSDLVLGARLRSGGSEMPWRHLFNTYRLMRLEWMVPGVGFAVLAAALPVAALRARSKPGELVLLAWTFMATFQYLAFPQGADIHIFWPHYYGPCVALALGTLASALLPWHPSGRMRIARGAAIGALVVLPIAMLGRVGFTTLDQSRLTQGRFDEHELFIESGADASQFADWATHGLPPASLVRCTRLCAKNVEYGTGLAQVEGPFDLSPRDPADRDRVMLVDARATFADDLRALTRSFDTVAVGPFLRVDLAMPGTGVRAMQVVERQPTGLERLLVTDHDLVRSIEDRIDPWSTWAWADALGTAAAPTPEGEPAGIDQLSIAHNVAWEAGDPPRALALRHRAMDALDDTSGREFTGDVRLLGSAVERGPATLVTLLWETGPDFQALPETTFVVRCRVTEAPALWPAPIDPLEKEMAPPMTIKPPLWRPGHLYVQRFVLLHRPGSEACRGYFQPTRPRPASGRFDVDLFALR